MEKALEMLAAHYKLEKSDFSFVGETDYSNLNMGILYYFNIEKESHESYKSTVTHDGKEKEERNV